MTPPASTSRPAAETAGIMLWRRRGDDVEILLVHPGGPFWAKKDEHAWSIPKGEFDPATEGARAAALREFEEELGEALPEPGDLHALPPFRAGRKRLHAFAAEGDFDVDQITADDEHRSMVTLEWPPRSGEMKHFPEVDRAIWCLLDEAPNRLHKGQRPVVDAFSQHLASTEESGV